MSNGIPDHTGISIETMDGTFDIAKVSWQAVAPCGCVSGVTLGAIGDEVIVTADQAAMQFCETKAERDRDAKLGFTYRPREHKAACADIKDECKHEPKWGYEKPVTPSGYVWAACHKIGGTPKYTHLVPVGAIERQEQRRYGEGDTAPLCGGRREFHWHTEWYAKSGKVECSRCMSKAAKLVQA